MGEYYVTDSNPRTVFVDAENEAEAKRKAWRKLHGTEPDNDRELASLEVQDVTGELD